MTELHSPILTFEQTLARMASPTTHTQNFTTLVEGDCLEILPRLGSESVHLVLTDPPYYLDGLDTNWRKGTEETPRGTGSVGGLPIGMKFDPKQGRELQAFMGKVGDKLMHVLTPGGFAVVCSQPRLSHRLAVGLEDAGFEIRDLYAWHYTRRAQFKAFSLNHFVDRMEVSDQEKKRLTSALQGRKTAQLRPQFEALVLAQKPKKGTLVDNWMAYKTGLIDPKATLDGKAPSTIMTVEKADKETGNDHLTVKPVLLMEHLIRLFSLPGQIVLDPFLGSGTTAVAALRTGRSCIGIDINPDYITIAESRIQKEGQNGFIPKGENASQA